MLKINGVKAIEIDGNIILDVIYEGEEQTLLAGIDETTKELNWAIVMDKETEDEIDNDLYINDRITLENYLVENNYANCSEFENRYI